METPPAIAPDDKDWTWVLEQSCPECGFDATVFESADVGTRLRENAGQWVDLLSNDNTRIRTRPRPERWSALEYGAHVRDVNRLYLERLILMLTQDGPHYPNWDQDETALAERYHESDASEVAAAISESAAALADRFDGVSGSEWDRTGYRSDGAAFTIASFARYFIHDPIHHLHDVLVGFGQLDS